ncbi:MAG TPA: histidine ammonia-lyase [Thermoplasmata archaeon]|nr:histidine ammonia-lyase [Thermoplasmata archaeon]
MTESLPIDGETLALDPFLAVVRAGCPVSLGPDARARVESSRRAVERAVAAGRAIYGVTTGFGRLADVTVPPEEAAELQHALLRSHASGTGPCLPAEVVRGLLLLRLNSLARGHSGVRPLVLERLIELLNRQLVPAVPEQGSVGASGDLAPLAHLALAAIGEGWFVGPDGAPEPAAPVLEMHGLAPIRLAAKEGVALINGTSLMATYLALAVADARTLLRAATIAVALSFDALKGNPEPLDDRLGALKHQPEQRAVAAELRQLLEGSELARPAGGYAGQEPYTLRCAPQVLAAARLAVDFAGGIVARELNAVSDNPVVFEGDEFVSGGNFHGQHLALGLDTLALGVQYVAGFAERRTARLVNPSTNRGLPAFLAPTPGLSSGFMIPQYLQAALVNENATLVHPASATSLPTSADQEDFVSMGAWAGAKARRTIANAARVVAVEWIVAAEALERRRPARGGRGSEAALRAVRSIVAPWAKDRPPAPEIERVAEEILRGTLGARVNAEVPPAREAPKGG